MKSVSGKYWEEEKYNQRIIDKIKLENNFSELITRLIIRNSFDKDEIYFSYLGDEFLGKLFTDYI